MSNPNRVLLVSSAILLLLLSVLIVGAKLNASPSTLSGNYGPPTRNPLPGTGGIDPEPDAAMNQEIGELQVLSGHGSDQAQNAFGAVLASLPFTPHLPQNLTKGMVIYHVAGNLEGTNRVASFDATYIKQTLSGRVDLHTFQTQENIPQNPNPEAQLNWAEVKTMSIGSKEWVYHLLIFPQPDGTKLRVHHISRIFEDGIYVSFDVKGGDPAEGLVLLKQIAADTK
jgi:hypothetical protein